LERPVLIEIRPKRYQCPHCQGGPTTTQRLSWYEPNSPHTRAFERWVLKCLINSTVLDVSRRIGIGKGAVAGIMARGIARTVDWQRFSRLDTLGIDEIALRKGHDDFVTVVSSRTAEGKLAVLGVLADRQKETVKAFLSAIPAPLQATIRRVCTDMYEGYTNAVREALPGVELIIDRFHVAKAYRGAADALRKQTLKQLKESLSQAEYEPYQGLLWIFRQDWAALDEAHQSQLAGLFAQAPDLGQAYWLRTVLTAIFETSTSKAQALERLERWQQQVKASGLACFDRFLKTLDSWREEIANYFHERHSSGFVEGLNNKLKVIKRRCYGLLDPGSLFQRIQLDLEGERLFAP
jgi:transposase